MKQDGPEPSQAKSLDTMVLIERYHGGDRGALEELWRRYYPRVERIVRVRLGSELRRRVEVADVVQDTLLSAFKGLDDYRPREDARFIDWMATIAMHSTASLAKHEKAQKRDFRREVEMKALRKAADQETAAFDIAADTTAIVDKVSRNEMEEIVDEALSELADDWREAILLRDYAGASWSYVAEALERPSESAAKQLHQRARRALVEKVEKRMGD